MAPGTPCHNQVGQPNGRVLGKTELIFFKAYPYKPGSVKTQINHRWLLEIWHPIGCELCQTKPNKGRNKQTQIVPGRPTLYWGGILFLDKEFSFESHFIFIQSFSLFFRVAGRLGDQPDYARVGMPRISPPFTLSSLALTV
jgi:hypothetical protein